MNFKNNFEFYLVILILRYLYVIFRGNFYFFCKMKRKKKKKKGDCFDYLV